MEREFAGKSEAIGRVLRLVRSEGKTEPEVRERVRSGSVDKKFNVTINGKTQEIDPIDLSPIELASVSGFCGS